MERQNQGEKKRTLAHSAYNDIRNDIVGLHFEPKAKLRIRDLTDRYGYSAAPLREALSRLVSEDLVVAEEQRGFSVSDVTREDLSDLTFVRRNIESIALKAAIENGDEEWEGNVVGIFHRLSNARMRETDNPTTVTLTWKRLHRSFHHTLVAACGSPRLLALRDLLFDQADRYRHFSVSEPEISRDIEGEHRALFEATIGRDADLACRLITEHIECTAEQALFAMTR